MNRPKVLNLIQKFEQLSNDVGAKRSFVRKKINAPVDQPSVPVECVAPASVESTPSNNQLSWKHKPLLEIEAGIRKINQQLRELNAADDTAIYSMLLEMMDLLIQLNSIDTDGLKAMKVKKDCCLADLRNTKDDLKAMLNCKLTPNCPIATQTNFGYSIENMNEDITEEETIAEPNTLEASGNVEILLPAKSVQSLMQQFEGGMPQRKTIEKPKNPLISQVSKKLNISDSGSDEESQQDSAKSLAPQDMTLQDINSEIEYYKEEILSLDPDDYIKIESIEEHLEQLLVRADRCPEAREEIRSLLVEIKQVGNVEMVVENTEEENTLDSINDNQQTKVLSTANNVPLQTLQKEGVLFIRKERENVFASIQVTPQIIVNEITEMQTTPEEIKTPGEDSNIQLLDINIPGDNRLVESSVMIENYKERLLQYLGLPKAELFNVECMIEDDYTTISRFTPHPNAEETFLELCSAYQELMTSITEEKFQAMFNESIRENGDEATVNRDKEINAFHRLCDEVGNYYPHIEKIEESTPFEIQTLQEMLLEVSDEIQKIDVSHSKDLSLKKKQALGDLSSMMKKLLESAEANDQ